MELRVEQDQLADVLGLDDEPAADPLLIAEVVLQLGLDDLAGGGDDRGDLRAGRLDGDEHLDLLGEVGLRPEEHSRAQERTHALAALLHVVGLEVTEDEVVLHDEELLGNLPGRVARQVPEDELGEEAILDEEIGRLGELVLLEQLLERLDVGVELVRAHERRGLGPLLLAGLVGGGGRSRGLGGHNCTSLLEGLGNVHATGVPVACT